MNGRPEPAVRWIRCFVKFRTHANNTSRLDTLIRSYAAQDVKTGLNNRLFFDNQLATLLEIGKVGTHGIVMMIRLPDFNMLSDTQRQVEDSSSL